MDVIYCELHMRLDSTTTFQSIEIKTTINEKVLRQFGYFEETNF